MPRHLTEGETLMTTKFTSTVRLLAIVGLLLSSSFAANGAALNGTSDYGTYDHGVYYAISGGLFPTGTTPNGDNASGGTYRYLSDRTPSDGTWIKDDWWNDNAGIGLTLRGTSGIVYDNNGLEPDAAIPADPNYYDYYLGNYPVGGHGAHNALSMSNNWDFIYAGYFKIESDVTITSLTGYFNFSSNPSDPLTYGFDPADPEVGFRMNIWSNVDGDLLPTDTGSFDGDVFTSDTAAGTFSFSDTGFNRVGSSTAHDIYRLTYTLDTPLTLQPGVYWFSHDAVLTPIPEPSTIAILGLAGIAGLAVLRRRRQG